MVGIDAMVTLPVLLIFSVFAAFILIGVYVLSETLSEKCPECGTMFPGREELKRHMKDHSSLIPSRAREPAMTYKKAA